MQSEQHDGSCEAVRADVRTSDASARALALFAWRDHETGEVLVLELRGSEDFLAELEALGFERMAGEAVEAPVGLPGGIRSTRPSLVAGLIRT